MSRIIKTLTKLIIIFIILCLIFIFLVLKLSAIPFGWQFNLSIIVLVISFIGLLSSISFKLFISKNKWIKVSSIFPLVLTILLIIISLLATKSYEFIAHRGPVSKMNKEKWEQDLNLLVNKYKTEYPNLYGKVDSIFLDNKIEHIRNFIESGGTTNQIQMSILDMHASLNDAHSIPLFFDPGYNLHFFPIRIYPFKEGWFVTAAGRSYKNIVGTQIIAINHIPIEKIFKNYEGAFAYESESGKLDRFKLWGLMSEWLFFKGYTTDLNNALFTFKNLNGEELSLNLPVIRGLNMIYWTYFKKLEDNSPLVFENTRKEYYWFRYNKEKENLYVQFNKVENQEGKPSIADFTEQLKSFVSNNNINKFILDLRINDGGNDSYLVPLFNLIKNNNTINHYGKLFILIGPHTFSSAAIFAWKLQMQTEAILIGEPTSQGVSFNANPQFVRLPNSKMVFTLSKTSTDRTQPKWVFHPANSIYPDKEISLSVQDFINNTDPVIQYANNYNYSILNEKVADTSIIKVLIGRYRLSDFHELNIVSQVSELKMIINDFIDGSLYQVEKELIYRKDSVFTDHNNLYSIKLVKDGTIKLTYDNQSIIATKDSSLISAFEAFKFNEIENGLALIKANSERYIKNNPQLENILVNLGYKYLSQDSIEKSLLIFRASTEIFPNSWNTFDSYAEALAKKGQTELAIKNYEKSVQLNSNNNHGKEMIQNLKNQL